MRFLKWLRSIYRWFFPKWEKIVTIEGPIVRLSKESMEVNVIYAYVDHGGASLCFEALAKNGLIYSLRTIYLSKDVRNRYISVVDALMNTLYDVEMGGDGEGSSGHARPVKKTYTVVHYL